MELYRLWRMRIEFFNIFVFLRVSGLLVFCFIFNRPVFTISRLPNIQLFELSRSQTTGFQLNCVFIRPKQQLAGYLVRIVIPRYLGIVCKISSYLSCASSPDRRLALCANAEQNISRSRSNIELMKTRFVTSGLFPESEIAGYFAISR